MGCGSSQAGSVTKSIETDSKDDVSDGKSQLQKQLVKVRQTSPECDHQDTLNNVKDIPKTNGCTVLCPACESSVSKNSINDCDKIDTIGDSENNHKILKLCQECDKKHQNYALGTDKSEKTKNGDLIVHVSVDKEKDANSENVFPKNISNGHAKLSLTSLADSMNTDQNIVPPVEETGKDIDVLELVNNRVTMNGGTSTISHSVHGDKPKVLTSKVISVLPADDAYNNLRDGENQQRLSNDLQDGSDKNNVSINRENRCVDVKGLTQRDINSIAVKTAPELLESDVEGNKFNQEIQGEPLTLRKDNQEISVKEPESDNRSGNIEAETSLNGTDVGSNEKAKENNGPETSLSERNSEVKDPAKAPLSEATDVSWRGTEKEVLVAKETVNTTEHCITDKCNDKLDALPTVGE